MDYTQVQFSYEIVHFWTISGFSVIVSYFASNVLDFPFAVQVLHSFFERQSSSSKVTSISLNLFVFVLIVCSYLLCLASFSLNIFVELADNLNLFDVVLIDVARIYLQKIYPIASSSIFVTMLASLFLVWRFFYKQRLPRNHPH